MNWPPKIPTMPPIFGDLFRAIIARLDATWPVDGNGIRVVDAAGGRSINLFGTTTGGSSAGENKNLTCHADGTDKVRVLWGTICFRQPKSMTAGDRKPLTFRVGGGDTYFYATAKLDLRTRQWIEADVVIGKKEQQQEPTRAWKLIGTASNSDSALEVTSWEGGDVEFGPCGLPVDE